jgi:hypothetical protein
MRTGRGIWAVKVPATIPGAPSTVMSASCRLCGWSIVDQGGQPVVTALDVAIAAAAAGSLTLTGFQTVSLVTVTPSAAWPAGVNQVTLTNVTGGTQTVDIEGGTTNAAVLSFPNPIATTGTPVVSVPAIVGGPAYTIEAVGTVAAASFPAGTSTAQFQDGNDRIAAIAPIPGRTDNTFLSDCGIYVGNSLVFSVVSGLMSGVAYVRDADDDDYAEGTKY